MHTAINSVDNRLLITSDKKVTIGQPCGKLCKIEYVLQTNTTLLFTNDKQLFTFIIHL